MTPDTERTLILNVDDNDGARYAKSRVLRLAGFAIAEAANGSEALAQVRALAPALVLLDTKLPDLNGFEVCRRIKADPQTRATLVLQTSASFLGSADKIRALEGGADNYLVEPIEPEELLANVNALLRLGRVESRLRESEERFRQIAENIGDVFWVLSPTERRVLYVSPAYPLLWQLPAAAVEADLMDWMRVVHPDDRERVAKAFGELLDWQPYDHEYRLRFADGRERWIRDRGFPVHDDQGLPYRIARISQDVSERKRAERILTDSDRLKDEFLATLAHELRNPLGPILNSAALLRVSGAATSAATMQNGLQMITRQTQHLVRLVDDLMDISRISQGKVTIRCTDITVRGFVDAAVESVEPFLKSRGHTLDTSLPQQDVWLHGDAVRLTQIVGNLLHNAGKYTAVGGRIELAVTCDANVLTISVSDNGIGIAAEKITSIFDLFTQADFAPDRAQDGLGIGLSLVRELAQLHGGSATAASAGQGRGATFTVALPIVAAGPPAVAVTAAPDAAANPMRRILIVDDNHDSADTLAELLEVDGHRTAVTYDGQEALALAAAFEPDVVILDIGLPGMNGYEVAGRLRLIPQAQAAVLIALTGYGQLKDKVQASDAGFDHHVVKPIEISALVALIDALPPPGAPAQ